ncbi:MAG: hypothetical protein K940chlam7_01093 [Chlamydiae bacterium]|nr:hypothetical protein [Chlamydiota bacterium]
METAKKNHTSDVVDASNPKLLSTKKRPTVFLFFAFLFIFVGYLLTAQNLVHFGVMKTSLTHELPRVRHIAILTVTFFRLAMFLLGICFGLIFLFWKKIYSLNLIQTILKHQPIYPRTTFTVKTIFNRSFFIILALACASLLFILYSPYLSNTISDKIMKEDGIAEWLTALTFLFCSVIAAANIFISPRIQYKITFLLFSLLFFLCFGEEISWGQRIFGFASPEAIKNINAQEEFNLHNSFGYLADHLFFIAIFSYGCVMPLLSLTHEFWHRLFDKLGIPIASAGLAIGFFISLLFYDPIFFFFFHQWAFRIAEIRELLISASLLILLFEARNFFATIQPSH